MSTNFKFTGHPQPANTASIAGSGVIIPSPGADKAIVILDILANSTLELRENDADGYLIAYIPPGSTRLDSCINAGMGNGSGNAVYCMGSPDSKTTVTFVELPEADTDACSKWDTSPPVSKNCEPYEGGCCEKVVTRLGFASYQEALTYMVKHDDPVPGGSGTRIVSKCGDGFGETPCDDLMIGLGPGSLCYNMWCYRITPPRGTWAFKKAQWGYSLCGKIPCASSSSSSSSS